jgi:3-oxoacyl-[acyl-carrier protein] reductase
MKSQGFGRVVNISSHGAYKPAGAYAISKIALNQLTWNLAKELGAFGVTVNGVAPGTMDLSNTHDSRGEAAMLDAAATSISRRLGHPDDIYAAIRYLISDEAEFCTAQTLMVNGGAVVRP